MTPEEKGKNRREDWILRLRLAGFDINATYSELKEKGLRGPHLLASLKARIREVLRRDAREMVLEDWNDHESLWCSRYPECRANLPSGSAGRCPACGSPLVQGRGEQHPLSEEMLESCVKAQCEKTVLMAEYIIAKKFMAEP